MEPSKFDQQDSVRTARGSTEPAKKPPESDTSSLPNLYVLNFMKDNARIQLYFYQAYVYLRYVLIFGNLSSSIMKLPSYYEMINMAIQLYIVKKNKAKDVSAAQEQPPPPTGMILNVAFLYVAFIALILYQFYISIRLLQKRYTKLLPFLLLFVFYLVFVLTAYFTDLQNSTMPLAFSLFLVKYTLFGFWEMNPPDFWYYTLLKCSIWFDGLLLLAFFVFFWMVTRYKDYTVNGKSLIKRVYDLVENV